MRIVFGGNLTTRLGTDLDALSEPGPADRNALFSACLAQPAEGAHAGKPARQSVLQKAAHPFEQLQLDGSELAGFAVAIGPQNLALRQQDDFAIARGGLEDVTRQITQGILSGTGGLGTDVPWIFPNGLGHLREQCGMFLEQSFLKECAHVGAQGLVMEQELFVRGDPLPAVGTESATGDEIMNVRMND